MKVIFFTKYSRKGASSRLRTYQYVDFLSENGVDCDVSPFFSDEYLAEVYRSKTHNKLQAVKSFLSRCARLLTVWRYEAVVIEKELFPFFPSWPEFVLKLFGVKYIVDYDDAIFHNYDIHPSPVVRAILGNKIRNVMAMAEVVVVGNKYLKEKALEFGAKNVQIVPTVIDVSKYGRGERQRDQKFTIGWVGSPITFKYLPALKEVFEELGKRHRIRLKLVGANRSLNLVDVEESIVPWSEDAEVREIQTFDVGIMPLEDNIWERGKCGYKLIQYMGCEVAVIGTPIGANDQIIQEGVNGFKATTREDWQKAFEYLIAHPEQRTTLGKNGRLTVEKFYSLQEYRVKWLEILKSATK